MIDADPAPVAVVENSTRLGLLLVIVICSPEAAPVTLAVVSRFFPTVTFGATNVAGLTVTVTTLPEAGVLNPAGATAVRVAVPVLLLVVGVKTAVPELSPPANV